MTPKLVNTLFAIGVFLMLSVLIVGLELYAIEAFSENMRRGFRSLECAPQGLYLRTECSSDSSERRAP